jgi:hypothetical protein
MPTHRFLRRKAASDYLRETHGLDRAPSTLAKLAVTGGGPIFRRANRVPLYSTEDLDAWVKSKLSPPMRSTSELAPANSPGTSIVTTARPNSAPSAQQDGAKCGDEAVS